VSPAESDISPHPLRWCTAEAPAPRLAYLGAAEAYPGLPTRLWCRLYRLMEHRGLLDDPCALRIAGFLADTDTVAGDGVIGDVPAMIAAYAARAHVSAQTAWTDLGRLTGRGLVRQVRAAAPGQSARYRLSAPAAMIAEEMPGLPAELACPLGLRPPRCRLAQAGEEQEGGGGDGHHQDHDEQDQDPARPSSCGGLDTSPSTREGYPPSPSGTASAGPRQARHHRSPGISDEEKESALSVLSACRGEWLAQRGPLGVPGAAELARIEPLAALALRHVGPGEMTQLLTWQVASSRDLPAVLAWRLGRVVAAARRRPARHVPADETGQRYAATLTRLGNSAYRPDPHGDTPGAVALRAARARLGRSRLGSRWHDDRELAAAQAAESRAARALQPVHS